VIRHAGEKFSRSCETIAQTPAPCSLDPPQLLNMSGREFAYCGNRVKCGSVLSLAGRGTFSPLKREG
jgi:hypothetical protein